MPTPRNFAIFLTVILFLLVAGSALAADDKIPVVLSTDVGNEIDDQWAIVYTLLSPEFEVLGVMSAHAPSIAPPAGKTAHKILKDIVECRLGMKSHPPLLEGASEPLVDAKTPRESEAAKFLIGVSKSFSPQNRLRVLTIGAVTDVASAILIDPSIVDRIEVLDMGFDDWPTGKDSYNILNDITSAQIVFASNVPIVVGCAKVCRENLGLGFEQARQMVSKREPIGTWLWDEFAAWYYRFLKPSRVNDFSKKWIIWDTIVVAHLLGLTKSEIHDRPNLKDDVSFEHVTTGKKIVWITDLDEELMWADFLRKLDNYQKTHALGPYQFTNRLTFLMP